jgi:DHA2 family multidrug resistance protein-like MFS transporter
MSGGAEPEVQAHPRRWMILVALYLALLVIVVDNTVLTVALPAIARAFDAGTSQLQAVVDAYVVVFAGLLVAAGIAADRFGRRRMLLVGLVVFGVASGLAAASWSVWWLVGTRALMGVGGALVLPATLAVVVQVFPAQERPRAFAIWFAVAAGALAVGPVLGGLLVSWWSWAAVFLINPPIAVLAMVCIARLVPESRDPDAPPLNLAAAALVTVGLCALTEVVILFGEQRPAGAVLVAGTVIAVAALGGFGWHQRRSSAPMVDSPSTGSVSSPGPVRRSRWCRWAAVPRCSC